MIPYGVWSGNERYGKSFDATGLKKLRHCISVAICLKDEIRYMWQVTTLKTAVCRTFKHNFIVRNGDFCYNRVKEALD